MPPVFDFEGVAATLSTWGKAPIFLTLTRRGESPQFLTLRGEVPIFDLEKTGQGPILFEFEKTGRGPNVRISQDGVRSRFFHFDQDRGKSPSF